MHTLHDLGQALRQANGHANGRSDKKRRTPYRERERGPFKGKKKLKIHALPQKWPSSGVTFHSLKGNTNWEGGTEMLNFVSLS